MTLFQGWIMTAPSWTKVGKACATEAAVYGEAVREMMRFFPSADQMERRRAFMARLVVREARL